MLQQQKKQFQIYFRLFQALPGSYQQPATPVDNMKKPPQDRSLQQLENRLKSTLKRLKNIFSAVQKTTSPIDEIYQKTLYADKRFSNIS